MATLALLSVGHNSLFTPPLGRIPDGIIESRKATQDEKNYNKKLAKDYASVGYGWEGKQWKCLESLWTSESRFDHYATNQRGSSAFGIAQLLGEQDRRAEYQILRGLKYISKRYQSPCRAYQFHLKHNYY
jgi:hypothetical protein